MKRIIIRNKGYINCQSVYYSTCDILDENKTYIFESGVNIIEGDIDSGIWGISYLISMYSKCNIKTLFLPTVALVDDVKTNISELEKSCCYMDISYPLFSSRRRTVHSLIKHGLKKSKLNISPEEIKDLFCLDSQRFDRPIVQTGNERYRAMAAVAYAYGKDVYCFPWFSKTRAESLNNNIKWLLPILASLNKILIVPVGKQLNYYTESGVSYSFTWTGRRLTGATTSRQTMHYTYNDVGLRTSKTVNGVTTKYLYSGTRLISEITDSYVIVYIYDNTSTPIGFKYTPRTGNGTTEFYWY